MLQTLQGIKAGKYHKRKPIENNIYDISHSNKQLPVMFVRQMKAQRNAVGANDLGLQQVQ